MDDDRTILQNDLDSTAKQMFAVHPDYISNKRDDDESIRIMVL